MKKLMIVLFATLFGVGTVNAFAQDKGKSKGKGDEKSAKAKKGEDKKKK